MKGEWFEMKRIIVLLLAAALCLCLAACGVRSEQRHMEPQSVEAGEEISGGEDFSGEDISDGKTAGEESCGEENSGKEISGEENSRESGEASESKGTAEAPDKPEGAERPGVELAGMWHLDAERNESDALAERFPGYGEWGAGMEICGDGRMNWCIGAESWQGNWTVQGDTLHAELESELEELSRSWDIRIVTEGEEILLEMEYEDMTLRWAYGEQADAANGADNG